METESSSLGEELLGRIREDPAGLEEWLVELAGADEERRASVADVVSAAARQLAPDDEPPREQAEAWAGLVRTVDQLFGSGAALLGRLPFLSDALLGALVAEARERQPGEVEPGRRGAASAGDVLAGLAVSRQLREAIGAGLGLDVAPTYDAVYLYEPPGSHVRTHVDARDYEIVFHLVLEHELPVDGSAGSALVVHLPDEAAPKRLGVHPGEAVALRGRGTIHSWEPLRDGEHRTLTAVGFERYLPR